MQLLERDHLLVELNRLLGQASAGTGAIAFVGGEAGIGKTSLLAEFASTVGSATRVLWAGCDPLQTPSALGPLQDVLRQLSRDAAQQLAKLPRPELFARVLDEFAERPSILVLEDLHWADAGTLDLLRYLGRRIDRTCVLLLATYRDEGLAASDPLRVLLGDLATQRTSRLTLAPLSLDAVRMLAGEAGIDAAELHAQTAGNPFFVTEVIAGGGSALPVTVRDAVLARAARLGVSARALLDVVAVAGPRVEPWLLERLTGAESAAVDECLAHGVLRADGAMFVFRHELARQAVLDGVPPWRRVQLHRRVLQALEAVESVDVARLVHHAALGQLTEAVQRWAPQAAEKAAAHGAHREAAAHYAMALAHAAAQPAAMRASLLEGRAYECYLIGEIAPAIEAREAALALRRQSGDQIKEGDNLRSLSRLHWFLGLGEEARRLADAAVALLETLPPGVELAMAYSNKAQMHMLAGEVHGAIAWGERALELAQELQAPEIFVHALNNVGTSRACAGDELGWAQLESSLELALERGMEEHAARAFCNIITTLVTRRQYARAETYLDAGIGYCADRDLDTWTTYLLTWRARARMEQGRWDDAAADAGPLIERPGVPAIARMPALAALGTIRLRRNDPGAIELLDEAHALALAADELQRITPVALARAEAAWLTGDSASCAAEARACLDVARRRREPWTLGEAASWAWRAGALHDVPRGCAEPFERQLRGDWQGAAEIFQTLGCPYEEALALAGGHEAAQAQALAILDRLGAQATAQTLRKQMRGRGARFVPRAPRATTLANAAGLTAREVDVLGLLAQGLSNAQIGRRRHISVRTVDHHVAAVLRKLDVATRAAAVARAQSLRLLGQDRQPAAQI